MIPLEAFSNCLAPFYKWNGFSAKTCWVNLTEFEWHVCTYKHIFPIFPRGEKSMLWFFGESARSLQLSGYPWLCRNSQLPWPDASCWALLPEAFFRGGSARGVHAAQPDRSWEAHKVWWDSGGKMICLEIKACSIKVLWLDEPRKLLWLKTIRVILYTWKQKNTSAPEYVYTH